MRSAGRGEISITRASPAFGAPHRCLHREPRDADARADAHAALLGDDVLSLRLPGDLARALRLRRERVFVYLARPRLDDERTARLMAIACASSRPARSPPSSSSSPTRCRPSAPGSGSCCHLAWIYGAAALPFFFAGCVITLAISAWTREINRLYLFDLAGAALGCLLLVPALGTLGAIDTVLLVALLASVAGWLLRAGASRWLSWLPRPRSSPGTGSRRSWCCTRPRASRQSRWSSRAGTPSRA